MNRVTLSLLVAALLGATAFLVPAQASTPKLTGKVGPGFTITLKKGTKKVTTLKAAGSRGSTIISNAASTGSATAMPSSLPHC